MTTIPGLSKRWAIYAICHPQTGQTAYIGKTTKRLSTRLEQHIRKPTSEMMRGFLRMLMLKGLMPVIVEIESGVGPAWAERERYWIAAYRAQGRMILNVSAGGEGSEGHTVSTAARAAIGAKARERHRIKRAAHQQQIDRWIRAGKPTGAAALDFILKS